MDISVSYYSAEGGRSHNEDAVYLCEHEDNVLAMVADGLGGLTHGDRAARMAVKTISSRLAMEDISTSVLTSAVEQANSDIFSQQCGEKMCTTISALWLNSDRACICHVGDSRIYQFRNGKVVFQSKDHSVSQMAVLIGEIEESEIRGHKDRNRLVRALGAASTVKPDTDMLDIREGDAFLLCSDGFWELILEESMEEYLNASADAGEWLNRMRRHVEEKQDNDSDNNSAIAIMIQTA